MGQWLRDRVAPALVALVVGGMGGAGIQSQLEPPAADPERQIELRMAVERLSESVRYLEQQVYQVSDQIEGLTDDVKDLCRRTGIRPTQ